MMNRMMKKAQLRALAAGVLLLAAMCLCLPALSSAQELVCVVADGQYVNVRNRASSSAATWGALRTGEVISANPEEIEKGFFKTEFNERIAYVSVKFFEIPVEEHFVVEANGRVRLRKSPAGEADGFIRPGATVYVAAWRYAPDGSKWARCTGGRYISAEYLVPEKS